MRKYTNDFLGFFHKLFDIV